jgi:hypothetical protein
MGHIASHKNFRGMSVKTLNNRKKEIQAIAEDGGYSFEQAEKIYESSLGYGEGNVTIIDGNNADNLEEKKIVVGKINRNKKKYKTVLEDDAGLLYELDGVTPYVPAGSNENSEVSEDNKNNSGTDLKDIKRKRLAKYGRKKQGGVLRYPAELLTEHADYLQIDIERYEAIGSSYVNRSGGNDRYVAGNIVTNRAGRTTSTRLSRKPLINAGTILLPIPAQLQDSNNVVYGDSKLNGLAAAGVQALEQTMTDVGRSLAGEAGIDLTGEAEKFSTALKTGFGSDNQSALTNAADLVTKKLAAEAVNIFGANVTPNQLLARGNGEILNPNMELLFSDVTIRNFRFSFKLTPRNKKEAEQVKLIIRAFKRNMAPQAQGGVANGSQFFLRTPNIFKLRYRSGNKDHPFLHKFKQCFLTDMQTTYTADGVYSTYEDGTPVSMQMDLSFKELQPIYDIDYDVKPGNRAVGY